MNDLFIYDSTLSFDLSYKVRSQCEDESAKEQREFVGSKPLHNCGNMKKTIGLRDDPNASRNRDGRID